MKVQLSKRRLIPRWRKVSVTLSLPEGQAKSVHEPVETPYDPEPLDRAIEEWRQDPTAGHLGDVLSFSVNAAAMDKVMAVANSALHSGAHTTAAQDRLIKALNNQKVENVEPENGDAVCNPHLRAQVKHVRELLRISPKTPLALLDLAQLQLAVGNQKRAERSILTALSLSPNNRIVVRTAARFFVHRGEPDRAHRMVARHERTKIDPWLMASEIALSQAAGVPPRYAKVAAKVAREKRQKYTNVTELAGAVAGLEMLEGNWKRAREYFRVALLSPNDNVIAQAVTDQRELQLDLTTPEKEQATRRAAEARMIICWRALDTDGAEREAILWHNEEPFSSRPLQFLSALYAVKGEYHKVVRFARRGLIIHPKDALLTANMSYGLANIGQLDEAERAASRARIGSNSVLDSQVLATRGLVEMKKGNFTLADALYLAAIQEFETNKHPDMVGICYAYYLRSALQLHHPGVEQIIDKAIAAYEAEPSIDAALVLRSCMQAVQEPAQTESLHRLVQWVYDKRTNSLIRKDGVGPLGGEALLLSGDSSVTQ